MSVNFYIFSILYVLIILLRDELNKLLDMENYENIFNDINDELTILENVRENIYEDFIRSL